MSPTWLHKVRTGDISLQKNIFVTWSHPNICINGPGHLTTIQPWRNVCNSLLAIPQNRLKEAKAS